MFFIIYLPDEPAGGPGGGSGGIFFALGGGGAFVASGAFGSEDAGEEGGLSKIKLNRC